MEIPKARINEVSGDIMLIRKTEKGGSCLNLSALQRHINKTLENRICKLEEENARLKEQIREIKNALENHNLID